MNMCCHIKNRMIRVHAMLVSCCVCRPLIAFGNCSNSPGLVFRSVVNGWWVISCVYYKWSCTQASAFIVLMCAQSRSGEC